MKRNGFNKEELLKVYKTMLRPVADYACAVYHSSLSNEQDEKIERLQSHALKCIYGPWISARKMRDLAGITTLRKRRETICDKFVKKCLGNPLFDHWFLRKMTRTSHRNKKTNEEFLEKKARCKRLFDSPIFYFRRRLNGKVGKEYGKRNAEYRE